MVVFFVRKLIEIAHLNHKNGKKKMNQRDLVNFEIPSPGIQNMGKAQKFLKLKSSLCAFE